VLLQLLLLNFYRISGGSTSIKCLPRYIVSFTVDPAEWAKAKKKNALPIDSIQKQNYAQLGRYDGMIDELAASQHPRVMKDPDLPNW